MKLYSFLVFAVFSTLILAACRLTNTGVGEDPLGCAATIAAIRSLREAYPLPEHFNSQNAIKQGGEFDPMLYFTVLDRLSMEDGYILDFVYTNDGMGGYPTLLARPADVPPYRSWEDVSSEYDSYLTHVVADGSEESFFQLAILALLGEQFYLFWHANYNDWQVVCNRDGVQAIVDEINQSFVSFSPLQQAQALGIPNIPPTVRLDEKTAEVRLIAFTRWGGFYRFTWIIFRQFPHEFQSVQNEPLVPYDCGLQF